ncbi:MAG TPA: hypothetical protein VF669_17425 [Tepidisphaeraceae bacterium]|jgi:hypothetical protein
MSRETKLNLIVLGVVLALLAPGAVLLVKKRMRPSLRNAWMPESVRRTVAVMVPGETPPGMERVFPSHTDAWVREVMKLRGVTGPMARDAAGLPVMSERRTVQLINVRQDGNATVVTAIVWDVRQKDQHEAWFLHLGQKVGENVQVAEDLRGEQVEVPSLVREELGENGAMRPPKTVQWTVLTFGAKGVERGWVERSLPRVGGDRGEPVPKDFLLFVTPFTSSVKSTN